MAIDTIKATAILDGAVDTADLADGAVTTAKITDGEVTVGKLASTLDLSSNTVTLPDGNITTAKLDSTLDLSGKTLTLPAGVVDSDNLASGAITSAALPAGSVLQVVQGSTSTAITSSGGTPVDTGLTASITPSSSSNKILVLVMQSVYAYGGANDTGFALSLYRDSTEIYAAIGHSMYLIDSGNSAEIINNPQINYLDSPSSTSSITYKVRLAGTAGATATANWSSNTSTIILMEIAG